jgi:hypothetical protein
MKTAEELVAFIENPSTSEAEREKAISALNLLGVGNAAIEEMAYTYWNDYFAENIEDILKSRLVLVSHLLPDNLLNQCFSDVFQEYQQRKKDLGIDDIKKFWAP